MTENFNVYAFAGEALALSVQKGFDAPVWENIPSKLALVFSEIDEAECVKWRGELAEELADIAIRTLAILRALWGDSWGHRVAPAPASPEVACDLAFLPGNAATLLWPFIRRTNLALQAWRGGRQDDVRINLEMLLRDVWYFARNLGFTFEDELRKKHEKNKLRSQLHGNKESAG